MTDMPKGQVLLGKRALVLGIANEHSIAYGCAKVFRALGAELAITYLNEKAKPYVEPLARDLGAALVAPCDVGKRVSSRRCSIASPRPGAASTSPCTRSPSRSRRTCKARSLTARPRASRSP